MNIRRFFGRSRKADSRTPHDGAVKDAARLALKKYGKTFTDLARYDRGEKPLISLPR